ncbi:MAG: tail fiber domain-containing protein [Magnetococcales bacterium]|nr:tail fiber domain-containing protein [Magnetococcales bacterium]
MSQFQFNPITRQLDLVRDAIDFGAAYQGAYVNGTSYGPGDVVAESGKLYVCVQAGSGHDPATSPAWWDQLEIQGPVGPQGPAGSGGGGGDPTTITTTQVASLTTTQIGFLSTTAIGGMAHNALGDLTSGNPHTQYALVNAALTTTQLGAITTTQLGMLAHDALGGVSGAGSYHLSAGQVASIDNIGTTTAFAALSATAVGALATTAIGGISHNALGGLASGNPHTQYALVNAALTTTQLGAITTTQLGMLAHDALGGVSGAGSYHLSAGQVASIDNIGTTTAFAALSSTAVGALATTAIGGISHNALGGLASGNPHTQYALVNAALSTTQLAALTTTQLGTLNQTQLGALKMAGATAGTNGTIGFVPAPGAGEQNKVLRGDGIWVVQGGGLTWRGVWDTNLAYAVNDVVSYNGSTYVCILATDSTIDVPNVATTYWSLFMAQGSPDVTVATPVASASGAITLNMTLGGAFTTTLSENITSVTISNPPASGVCGTVSWIVTQHASSAKSVALPSGGEWATGTAPDLSTLGARYLLVFKTTNGGTNWTVGSLGGSGGGIAGLTPGGVVFAGADGKAAQDASNLHWDAANQRLGIGTNSPVGHLDCRVPAGADVWEDITGSASSIQTLGSWGSSPTLANMRDADHSSASSAYIDGATLPAAVGFVFPDARRVRTIKLYGGYTLNNVYFKVQKSDDGTTWSDVAITTWSANCVQDSVTQGKTTGGLGDDAVIFQVAGTVSATRWRVYFISVPSGAYLWISGLAMEGAQIAGNPYLLTATAAGRLGIGTQSPSAKLDVNNTDDSLGLRVYRAGTGTNAIAAFYSDTGGTATVQAEIFCDGSARNKSNTWGSFSDEKLKENITDATPKLEDLLAVRVRNFRLIGDSLKQIGVIAQELEPIFPGLVVSIPDYELIPDPDWVPGEGETEANRPLVRHFLGTFTKSVKYSIFVPMLIKALQELHAMHQALAARVAVLEGS